MLDHFLMKHARSRKENLPDGETKEIMILIFSTSLVQEDYIRNGRRGTHYYDTQIETLASYLSHRFLGVRINLVGVNTSFRLRMATYDNYRTTYLPCLFLRGLSPIVFCLSSFLFLAARKPSIVYIYSDGLTILPHFGTLLYCKLSKTPLFLGLRNPPATLCPMNPMSRSARVAAKVVDTMFLKHSGIIAHISKKAKLLLKSDSMLLNKSIVVPSSAQNTWNRPARAHRKEEASKEVLFTYWGIMDKKRKLDVLIRGFLKAKRSSRNFCGKLCFIGDGNDLDRLKSLVKKYGVSDILFKDYMKKEELYEFLACRASVALIPIPQEEFYRYSSPIKLVEAVASELPIVATDIESNEIVKKHNLGVLCDHEENSYMQAFLEISSSSGLDDYRRNCRNLKDLFTPKNVFKELDEIISLFLGA